VTAQARYVGVARPSGGVDPNPPRLVVDLTGPPSPVHSPAAAASITSIASIASTVDGLRDADLDPPPEPETRPWVRATVAAAELQPARYGRFSVHRKRLRRAILRRYELLVWACLAIVVAGVALVVVRGLPAGHPASAAPPRASATEDGVPAVPVDCAFAACPVPRLSGVPTRVRIPAIRVDSSLELLSLDASGHLQAPTDYQRAGWWTRGVAPGDPGPAVIAGHVDSVNGPAVFFELNTLRAGDLVEVDRGGQTVTFRVTETEQYPKNSFPTDRVYKPTPGPELRLITCGGSFDQSRGSYRDNIVVYAIAT
jgi:sortase (surface protein transpeptidase)